MSQEIYRFIVIERDVFVAHDMRDSLLSACPDCDVVHLRYPADLTVTVPKDDDHRSVILTKMNVQEVEASGLSSWADDHKAEIVIRAGDDPIAEVLRKGWRSLTSPFTREDIGMLVESLGFVPRLS